MAIVERESGASVVRSSVIIGGAVALGEKGKLARRAACIACGVGRSWKMSDVERDIGVDGIEADCSGGRGGELVEVREALHSSSDV